MDAALFIQLSRTITDMRLAATHCDEDEAAACLERLTKCVTAAAKETLPVKQHRPMRKRYVNLFGTLYSWGSGNYRPHATFLYKVASHVKKLSIRPLLLCVFPSSVADEVIVNEKQYNRENFR